MATTRERQEELTRVQRELPPTTPRQPAVAREPAVAVPRRSLEERLLEPISGRWAAIGAVAWVALVGTGIAVEPAPTNPDAVDPWFLDAIAIILLTAMVATFTGLWLRRRWGMAASLFASSLLVVSTLACPASGHHTFGAWWVVQLACGIGLVATSAVGLRRGS